MGYTRYACVAYPIVDSGVTIHNIVVGCMSVSRQRQTHTVEDCCGGSGGSEGETGELVLRLTERLREKDMKLTDVRLEALSSAHQREQLREMLSRMKASVARPVRLQMRIP